MFHLVKRDQRILEAMLVILTVAMTCLVYKTDGYRLVTLNLFFLPVVLAAFFLGRYTAGILAVFCVATTSIVCVVQIDDFATFTSPIAIGLAVTVWGGILCLTALLVGTLSDERSAQAIELHEAYVGVVEVLAKYLQGGDPQLNAFTNRVVKLSQRIGLDLKLSSRRIDDIRVAALMQGFSRIEVTTKVISKAVHRLEVRGDDQDFSFHGTDLAYSLGAVLRGAIPILLNQDTSLPAELKDQSTAEAPIGAKILTVARAYVSLFSGDPQESITPDQAIRELRADHAADYDVEVLEALERVVNERQTLVPA